jgi:hypothetical protein
MLIFSDWISDTDTFPVKGNPNLKSTMGLAMLVTLVIYILINLSIMGRALLRIAKAKHRKRQSIKMQLKCTELRASIALQEEERNRKLKQIAEDRKLQLLLHKEERRRLRL